MATLSASALQSLIIDFLVDIDGDAIRAISEGTLAESIKPFFMLVDLTAFAKLSGPMPLAEAEALYHAAPDEVLEQIRHQATQAPPKDVTLGALLSAYMIIFWLSQCSNVTPPICLNGTTLVVLVTFTIAVLGLCALGAAIEDDFEAPLAWPWRLLLAAGGMALIWPNQPLLEIACVLLVGAALARSIRQARQAASA